MGKIEKRKKNLELKTNFFLAVYIETVNHEMITLIVWELAGIGAFQLSLDSYLFFSASKYM